MFRIKRIYDKLERKDGFRVLVDRLWPRGLSKERANIDIWLKEIAPSETLRRWFSHDAKKWDDFRAAYNKELKNKPELIQKIRQIGKEENIITLLYSAKDEEHNNAIILKEFLQKTR